MLAMLIIYLIKRANKDSVVFNALLSIKRKVTRIGLALLLIVLTSSFRSNNHPETIAYKVMKNNTVIGSINISKAILDNSTVYELESDIKAKYLLKFNIKGEEKSIYKDDVLVYSSVYRKVNKKVKANHKITLSKGQYNLKEASSVKPISFNKIGLNLIRLYFEEPKNLNAVFCDNLKKMSSVKALGNGKYKVQFSKGKYNIFYYKNGKCIKVEAFSSLFNVVLIPA